MQSHGINIKGCLKMPAKEKASYYIQAGAYGPIPVNEDGAITFGELVRLIRKLYKLSPEYVAMLYGLIAGHSVTGRHVLRMEQTNSFFPRDPKRRWVLARLLNIPPALLALARGDLPEIVQSQPERIVPDPPSKYVDIEAYYTQLQSYWLNGYPLGVEQAIEDIQARIDRLHDILPYSRQKPHMVRLLCGYQIALAAIAQEQQADKTARKYLTNAVQLAREQECYDLLAVALLQREFFFENTGAFQEALRDFKEIRRLKAAVPPQLQGLALSLAGMSMAHLAQTDDECSTALSYLDKAERRIVEQPETSNFLFFAMFDKERYFLNRAMALMASPDKQLRSLEKAQECLKDAERRRAMSGKSISVSRQMYSDLIQAKVYFDQGYDPVAAATAEQILLTLRDGGLMHCDTFYLRHITELLQGLKQRAPREEFVISLEVEVMKRQEPYLFN
jgi:tetratricopeptide (TPR) repeat protein